MSAEPQAELTPRDYLLMYARRRVEFPHMDVTDEVADMSTLCDRDGRSRAFDELCAAVAERRPDVAESVLDLLTGGAV